ncbi:MAG: sulfatase-like hydrolase/transferase [Eubacteriales bacterium]|jgi:choline-sulfatase
MKDILLIFSDQHSYNLQHYAANSLVRTPNLDMLAASGTVMTEAYTSCPLCVPARMSFLSGQLPSNTGVLDNTTSLSSNQATFVHSLVAAGYETVLCGRMHFIGPDQRHGFSKRIAGDITHIYHNRPEAVAAERKEFALTLGEYWATTYMGAGNSPTLEYDRYVVDEAIKYLDEDHEKPQFLCIGTYAPHFPYVAPKELYDYYYERVEIPDDSFAYDEHPVFKKKRRDVDPEVVRAARAAYYGMVEFLDTNIGIVLSKWYSFLERNNREGIVIYVSDHGDLNGERGYYGKQIFYQSAVHIPMIIAGSGIPQGKVISTPTSIMDIGPTLCELTGAPLPPDQDGKSLLTQIVGNETDDDRFVVSELMQGRGKSRTYGRMVKWKNYKFITFSGYEEYDQLFDNSTDKYEFNNIIDDHPEVADKLRKIAQSYKDPKDVLEHQKIIDRHFEILKECPFDSAERWRTTENAVQEPIRLVRSKLPLFDIRKLWEPQKEDRK